MEYNASDSSGTDDDLPPSHQGRGPRGGQASGNGRGAFIGGFPNPGAHANMEAQIHQIEQEAYSSVLRAFNAQSDAITWEKESLITELRKELKISNEEHREILSKVNVDDAVQKIREWRKTRGIQSSLLNNVQPVPDLVPSPTISASRKRQRTSQSVPPQSFGAPSPAIHPQVVGASMQPLPSAPKRGNPPSDAKNKKARPVQTLHRVSSVKSVQYPSTMPPERGQLDNQGSSGGFPATGNPKQNLDPLIGRKVRTRWPDDNSFYEAVITDYNPIEGRHALVYDINTENETWEWVNLKEISPNDIQWVGEDPGISHQVGFGGSIRGTKKSGGHGGAFPGSTRGRESFKNRPKQKHPTSQNGTGKKHPSDIEILDTDSLIKEVERVFNSSHPDPVEIDKAKRLLKDHEQSLINALARLADTSDGESEEGGS